MGGVGGWAGSALLVVTLFGVFVYQQDRNTASGQGLYAVSSTDASEDPPQPPPPPREASPEPSPHNVHVLPRFRASENSRGAAGQTTEDARSEAPPGGKRGSVDKMAAGDSSATTLQRQEKAGERVRVHRHGPGAPPAASGGKDGGRVRASRHEGEEGDAHNAGGSGGTRTYQAPLWDPAGRDAPAGGNPRCEQQARQDLVKRACHMYSESGSPFASRSKLALDKTYEFLLVDDTRRTLYCELPKAACTSWKVLLANLTGKVADSDQSRLFQLVHDTTYHPKIGFRYLDTYSPEEREKRLKEYFKFIVVRNPYSRLLSAYENKLKPNTVQSQWYHENIGRYIVNHYRTGGKRPAQPAGDDVTFTEFVQFVASPSETYRQRYDAHFWNIQSVCWPCLIRYDYIAKVETLADDAAAVIERLAPGRGLKLPYLNHQEADAEEKAHLARNYHLLSDKLLTNLSRIYAEDSEMFGYRLDGSHHVACDMGADGCC